MEKEQLQSLIGWLNDQIKNANLIIAEAYQTNNIGRGAQYEGMRDAFKRCLTRLNH
jgi:hypothetical protein